MATGVVKWFNTLNKYGFITPDDGGEHLFALLEIKMEDSKVLKEGQKVQFVVTQGQKREACIKYSTRITGLSLNYLLPQM
jgi:CspA family cold shock protein